MNRKRYTETSDFLKMLRRMVRAAGKRIGKADVEDLVELAGIQDDLDEALRRGVAELRRDGYSWRAIGEAFGMTGQGAYYRFGVERRTRS